MTVSCCSLGLGMPPPHAQRRDLSDTQANVPDHEEVERLRCNSLEARDRRGRDVEHLVRGYGVDCVEDRAGLRGTGEKSAGQVMLCPA
jgi:hypothetical protein